MKSERPALVRDPHRPIDPFFHQYMRGSDRVVNLIEAPLVRDGEILAQAAGCLEAQAPVQIAARKARTVQIGGLDRLDREASIVDRQILR
ncbi:MAG: hypothetical protein E8D51_05240 [Nitrospira sp.]|nr:MAG: hypothetical protein E8D51_05240 [Nitrospira sp.]